MRLDAASVLIEALSSRHDRAAFNCGNDSLDRYIREQATQDIRRRLATVFAAVEAIAPSRICGFFTLSATSILPADLPREATRRLPRLPVPAALIGRLAVDRAFQGRGLGGILLADAVRKTTAAANTLAIAVLVVDPVDQAARNFYSTFGFASLRGPQSRMFLVLPSRSAEPQRSL